MNDKTYLLAALSGILAGLIASSLILDHNENEKFTPSPKGINSGRGGINRRPLENLNGRRCTAAEFREAAELGISIKELRELNGD